MSDKYHEAGDILQVTIASPLDGRSSVKTLVIYEHKPATDNVNNKWLYNFYKYLVVETGEIVTGHISDICDIEAIGTYGMKKL